MKTPLAPTEVATTEAASARELPKEQGSATKPTPEPWEEFLEDDADCCGGCHHKPR